MGFVSRQMVRKYEDLQLLELPAPWTWRRGELDGALASKARGS